jgi:hypothetical protein
MFRIRAFSCLIIVLSMVLLPASGVAEPITLQNDGFDGGLAAFQSGFATGEIAASVFDPPGPFPMPLTEILFLFGSTAAQSVVILHVWDDAAATANPGTELYTEAFNVTGSASAFSSIDLSAANVQVNGPFRVGLEFTNDGLPSVARDTDGTINTSKNFIRALGFGWVQSNLLGLTGDWVIRSVVGSTVLTSAPPALESGTQLTMLPNPFNPATQVSFDLPVAGAVTIRVYDLRGRQVDSVLEAAAMGAGPQEFTYHSPLPSGVYVMGAWSGSWSRTVKFTVVK